MRSPRRTGSPPDAFEIVPIRTSGDRIQDRPLDEVGGKGLFTKEIEEALLSGDDRPSPCIRPRTWRRSCRPGLVIGACLEREDRARRADLARAAATLDALPHGAQIGTASLRREALIRRARPDLAIGLLRGNVPTRLQRVEEGAFDATLLAAAGLQRLGLEAHITEYLPLERFPPACGQGALAVECRAGDAATRDLLAAIDHRETALALDLRARLPRRARRLLPHADRRLCADRRRRAELRRHRALRRRARALFARMPAGRPAMPPRSAAPPARTSAGWRRAAFLQTLGIG